MTGNPGANLDHLVKARECGDDERLWSMRGNDRLQEHLWTIMDALKKRQKSVAEI
jgi:hypothetical protein